MACEGMERDSVAGAANRRVLIVGDPALGRGLMRTVLAQRGYVVSSVTTAAEALMLLSHTRVALAVVAIKLADMPGLELAALLRRTDAPRRPPAILLFGDAWNQDAVLRDCARLGLQGYLEKPISISRLVTTVRQLVEREETMTGAESTSMDIDAPLDLAHLLSFTDGDLQLERELGSIFVSTAALYLDQMREALGRPEAWRSAAHALKGASANIGARPMAETAGRAETSGPEPAILDELAARLEGVKAFFESRARHAEASAARHRASSPIP